jgi:hypothetical protein
MIVVDLENVCQRKKEPKFVVAADVDPFNSRTGHGAWRQLKPFTKLWGGAAGYWEFLENDRVLFKHSMQHRNKASLPCMLYDARGSALKNFPQYQQYGLGKFYHNASLDNTSMKGGFSDHDLQSSRFLWFIDKIDWRPPDPRYLWVGIGGKVGGHAGIYRKEGAYGFIMNAEDKKFWEIGFSASGFGPGLGGSTGLFLIVVTAQSPKEIVGSSSTSWDFNLAFAGKIDGYIKACQAASGVETASKLGKVAQAIMQNAKLGKAGNTLYNALPALSDKGLIETFLNSAKIICSGLSTDFTEPGFNLIDLPVNTPGLELGILKATTTVEDAYPLFA